MNDLTVFSFESQPIRTYTDEDGETWFCFRDIAKVLEISSLSNLKKRLNEKGCRLTLTLTKGGKQNLIFVNEGNLYRMTCRSDKPRAKKFEAWVYDEVLPSIRRTGAYVMGQENKPVMTIEEIKQALAAGGDIFSAKAEKKLAGIISKTIRSELKNMFEGGAADGDDKVGYCGAQYNFEQWRLEVLLAVDAMKVLYRKLQNNQQEAFRLLNGK